MRFLDAAEAARTHPDASCPAAGSPASRSRIAATPLRRSGNSSHNSPVIVTACRVGAGDERRRLRKGRIEPVEAAPQRAGDLPHGDGAAVLGQRHLEVCAADVVAGRDGHGRASAPRFPRLHYVSGRVTRGARGGKRGMDVIPVIDVRHGLAVAAVRGQRADYRPLVTPLGRGQRRRPMSRAATRRCLPSRCSTSPTSTASRDGGATQACRRISPPQCPDMRLWIDDGTPRAPPRSASPMRAHATLVIGTESLGDEARRRRPARLAARPLRAVARFQRTTVSSARAAVLDEPQHWPHAVIVMTLARVGSGEGPDLQRIASIVGRAAAGASMPPEACATAPTSKPCTRPAPPACSSPRRCMPER